MINEEAQIEGKYKFEFLGEKFSNNFITYKAIIIGSVGVGKTSIINKLGNREFDKDYYPTISADIKTFQVKVNDKILQIQFWDACGNEEFVENTPNLFKNAFIALLVYAIDDISSFNYLEKWLNILERYSFDNSIFLIGNKNDLEKERKVSKEEGERFKNNYGNIKIFFEISAENGMSIQRLFEQIGFSIYEKNEIEEKKLEKEINRNGSRTYSLVKEDFTKNKEKEKEKEKEEGKCC